MDDLIQSSDDATASCKISVPLTYTVVKHWDDDDNAMGFRPDCQSVSIERSTSDHSNRYWKTVTLVENPTEEQIKNGYGVWSYSWSDEGTPWQYNVYESSTASGTLDPYYDEEGNEHTQHFLSVV